MSASRDKSQRVAFLYTNLYQLYRKEKGSDQLDKHQVKSGLDKLSMLSFSTDAVKRATFHSNIIKAGQAEAKSVQPLAAKYHPRNLENAQPHPLDPLRLPGADRAVVDLRENVQRLQGLQKRLRFMLNEIDDLSPKKKK